MGKHIGWFRRLVLIQLDGTTNKIFVLPQDCELAQDRSFDMSSIEGAEPLDPQKGLEKLLKEMGDVTCDYSINPPP